MEKSGFTVKAVAVGIAVTIFLLISSCYIALKIGALPWPIIFSVIVCAGLLRILSAGKNLNIHEINVAQAGGTIGGLLASGVAFTLPGIWYLEKTKGITIGMPSTWVLAVLCALAGLLGVLLSIPLRKRFVEEEKLSFASGAAGAEVLKAGKAGGKMLLVLIIVALLSGIFALWRDISFPAGFTVTSLAAAGLFLTFYPMPLAIGTGYIIGKKATFNWFFGALIGWAILIPLLVSFGNESSAAVSMTQNLGMGLLLGSGIGFFFAYITPKIKQIFVPMLREKEWYIRSAPLLSLLSIIILTLIGINVIASIITVVLLYVMVTIAARMTGEINIDPLEQFGILVVLIIILLFSLFGLKLGYLPAFLIAMFVSIACAVAGDIGHDYKSAKIIGTSYKDIIRIDLIAAIVAGLLAPFVLDIIKKSFSDILFTPSMPAPQSQLVASSIFGFAYPHIFLMGFVTAFVYEIIIKIAKMNQPILLMPLGIGMFLGFGIAIPLFIGGIIALIVERKTKHLSHAFLIGAAGMLGGEGIAGFSASALSVFGLGSYAGISKIMIASFFVALVAVLFNHLMRKK
ncbi:OPT/YSL family transporter [Candidatus Woesearchaeota archaeon]|nr:OPT/YSL family transporter [Candidatus Woesearchaeota archaeon]